MTTMLHSRLTSLLSLVLLAPGALAGTLYVDANLTTGLGDGSSWANAFQGEMGVQNALGVAVAGDQIFAAQGLYVTTDTTTRSIFIRLKNNVEIYGGFVGTESSPAERPPFGTATSTLSGDLLGNDSSGLYNDNSYHVINGTQTNASAVVDGFLVTGGNGNGSGNGNKGGGILCVNNTSPTIRNCDFVANRCTFGGGAGYINSSAPTFTDCTFVDNVGGSYGGAFDIATSGAVRFDRCRFEGNRANRAGALEIFATSGVIISNSIFVGNTATGSSGGGGLWIGSGGNTQVRNCTIVGNSSTSHTIGGLRVQGSTVTAANLILWNNTGAGGAMGSANQFGGTSVSYSIVTGGASGSGNLSSDPQFTDLAGGDVSLSLASPAIDSANNNMVPAGITLDYAHRPRFVDEITVADTGVGSGPIVDMGAYEYVGLVTTAFCSGDGTATACPCGNSGAAGEGCGNSGGYGSILGASGSQSLAADDLMLIGTQLPPGQSALLFAGINQQSAGSGVVFGDGLRCVAGGIRRFGVAAADGTGMASWGPGLAGPAGYIPGDTRHFQVWYRDPAGPCGSGFNTSNALTVQFMP